MHVGICVGAFRPDDGGGYTFAREVIDSFCAVAFESRHSFTVFCPSDTASYLGVRGTPPNVSVVELPPRLITGRINSLLGRVFPVFGYRWPCPTYLERDSKERGVNLMWFVEGGTPLLDMPYVATVWDLQHRTHPWFPEVSAEGEWARRELVLHQGLRRATRVITGTEVGKSELMFYYHIPEGRIRILPHPTPSFARDAFGAPDADVMVKYGLKAGFLLYPAQFWPHKNHVNLLLALTLLGKEHNSVELVLVGSDKGNRRHVLRKTEELGLMNRVRFLGFVSVRELVNLYKSASALVYPSFSGPENLPPLEAFGLGCPVIASDFPGAREQLGDAAQLFDPHEPSSIAHAISMVLSDRAIRSRLIERGKERAHRWTGEDFARGVIEIIDEFESVRRVWE